MGERVALILPALNEEGAIACTLAEISRAPFPAGIELAEVIVADNGSTDRTAEIARGCGARVVSEPRRGSGHACTPQGRDAAGCPVMFQ